MNWKKQWIDEVLAVIPWGSYRSRMEAELSDHLETQCRALMEAGQTQDEARAEALRVMGPPETLQREYMAAWRRSWPARLEELGRWLLAWVGGLAVMFVAQCLAGYVIGTIGKTEILLPEISFWLSHLLLFLCALIAGAFFLSRMFQTSRRPAVLISVGLCLYWANLIALDVWWEALDDHRTFWEEFILYVSYNAGFYFLALALCILLGVVFGHMSKRIRRSAAA